MRTAATRVRTVAAAGAALWLAGCGQSDVAGETRAAGGGDAFPVAQATLTGPITGGLRGHALWDSWFDLAELGYVDEEYFVAGRAKVQPDGAEADYVTRILITRPLDAQDFNGTVVLDWTNVTAQFENNVDTLEAHGYLMRHGYAFVHVSAQAAGVCCTPLTPQVWDPVRYETLSHPGDDYAFDMVAQIARALREPGATDAMGGLKVKRVLAMGQSQSAQKLHDYVNLGYARSRVIDGILIHGDVGSGKAFTELPVPVLQLLSDYEADPEEPAPAAPDNYRLWEIAGTAHTDQWVGLHQIEGQGPRTLADAPRLPASADADLHRSVGNYGEQLTPFDGICVAAGASFPMRYAVNAALDYLNRWDGGPAHAPPQGPRYAFDAEGALARDDHYNALGGIRYPPIDVPVASYVSDTCQLGGFTVPFTEVQLLALYPTHADYFCRMQAATRQTVLAGYLLPEDADDLMTRVEAASNRWLMAGERDCP
jgi:hypothetical protein